MITSISNARVKQVIQWKTKAKERRKDKVFLVEGAKMFSEAPSDWVQEVYVSEDYEKEHGTGYEVVTNEVFAKMSDTQTPQGILAVLKQPEYHLENLLETSCPLFVVLENLQDPGNLGTILRTGEGAGITGVIMSSDTVDIFNPKVIRSTMGSIYRVPFIYEDNLLQTMSRLHEKGVKTYAAHLQGKDYYDSISFKEPAAFLIGNEGNGLTEELARVAGHYLKIPMEGKVESLNAGIAAALLMYEAHRQRSLN